MARTTELYIIAPIGAEDALDSRSFQPSNGYRTPDRDKMDDYKDVLYASGLGVCFQHVYTSGRVLNHFHYADRESWPTQPRRDCFRALAGFPGFEKYAELFATTQ